MLCACNKSQAFKVRSAAHEVDENAFVMITETGESFMGKDFWNRRNKKQKLRVQRSFLCLFGAECQLGKGFNVDRAGEEVALGNITAHIPKLIAWMRVWHPHTRL